MRDRRDAEPARWRTMRSLACAQRERADGGVDRRRAERAGELAEPGGQQLVEVDVVVQVVLVRGDVAALVGCSDPDAEELRELLRRASSAASRASTRSARAGGRVVPPASTVAVATSSWIESLVIP